MSDVPERVYRHEKRTFEQANVTRNSKQKIGLLAVVLCQATMMAASGSEADLYHELIQHLTTVPVERGHGLLPDVSAEVCPLVTSENLERLRNARPADVKYNIGLANATGFPAGTTHWLVRGHWLDIWERMSLTINVNNAGFCQVFAGPLTVEEPNFDFDREGI